MRCIGHALAHVDCGWLCQPCSDALDENVDCSVRYDDSHTLWRFIKFAVAPGATAGKRTFCVGCLGQCGKKRVVPVMLSFWCGLGSGGSGLLVAAAWHLCLQHLSSLFLRISFLHVGFLDLLSLTFDFHSVSIFKSFILSSSISIFGSPSFQVLRFFLHFFDFVFSCFP